MIKLSIYYESLLQFIIALLPVEINMTRDVTITVLQVYMDFSLNYFDFKPSLVSGIVSLLPLYAKRFVFHEEPALELGASCFFTVLWMTMTLTFAHLVTTKMGMVYIDAEVLREGNSETLNNLEEGIIILDETNLQIKF